MYSALPFFVASPPPPRRAHYSARLGSAQPPGDNNGASGLDPAASPGRIVNIYARADRRRGQSGVT